MNEKQIRQIVEEESEADVIIHTAAISDVGSVRKKPEESYLQMYFFRFIWRKASDGRKQSVSVLIRCYTVPARATDHIGRDGAKPANIYGA